MKNLHKRILITTFGGILLLSTGVLDTFSQTATLRTLSGRIRWNKAMGVLPKSPGSTESADNICAQFFVVVTLNSANEKPYQYDIALEAKPEPSKPDYYSCAYEMQVPSGAPLIVQPGMGDGLAWPNAQQSRFHYFEPWIDGGRPTRTRSRRSFAPNKKEVTLGAKGMYLPFELVYDQPGTTGQTEAGPPSAVRLIATPTVFPTPYAPSGLANLNWDAGSDHPNAELWVKYNNSRERALVVKLPKGGQPVQVRRGLVYTYTLMDGRTVLASVVVVGQ